MCVRARVFAGGLEVGAADMEEAAAAAALMSIFLSNAASARSAVVANDRIKNGFKRNEIWRPRLMHFFMQDGTTVMALP